MTALTLVKDKETQTATDGLQALPASGHQNNFLGGRVPADIVFKANAHLLDHQRDAVLKFHAVYFEKELSMDEVGKLIDLSGPSISLLFKGKFNGNLDKAVQSIEKYFSQLERRKNAMTIPFVETDDAKKIFRVCSLALDWEKWGFIYGDGQVGKSECLKEDARQHPENRIYVEMPVGGAISSFLYKLAKALHMGTQMNLVTLRQRIIDYFCLRSEIGQPLLLTLDEMHRLMPDGVLTKVTKKTLDFIKELYNESKCGVVVCATEEFPMDQFLKQIARRRILTLRVSSKPSRTDLDKFAKAVGLPPSSGPARTLEESLITQDGLGMWITLLKMGAKIAAEKDQSTDWSHVLAARNMVEKLEGGVK